MTTKANVLLAGASLQQGGFAILQAGSGEQALEVFQQHQPDLVLLDVVMPGMDGFATCAALRSLAGGRTLPIVMVTGLDDVESIEQAYQVGATDFQTKADPVAGSAPTVRYILRASWTLRTYRTAKSGFAPWSTRRVVSSWCWTARLGGRVQSGCGTVFFLAQRRAGGRRLRERPTGDQRLGRAAGEPANL